MHSQFLDFLKKYLLFIKQNTQYDFEDVLNRAEDSFNIAYACFLGDEINNGNLSNARKILLEEELIFHRFPNYSQIKLINILVCFISDSECDFNSRSESILLIQETLKRWSGEGLLWFFILMANFLYRDIQHTFVVILSNIDSLDIEQKIACKLLELLIDADLHFRKNGGLFPVKSIIAFFQSFPTVSGSIIREHNGYAKLLLDKLNDLKSTLNAFKNYNHSLWKERALNDFFAIEINLLCLICFVKNFEKFFDWGACGIDKTQEAKEIFSICFEESLRNDDLRLELMFACIKMFGFYNVCSAQICSEDFIKAFKGSDDHAFNIYQIFHTNQNNDEKNKLEALNNALEKLEVLVDYDHNKLDKIFCNLLDLANFFLKKEDKKERSAYEGVASFIASYQYAKAQSNLDDITILRNYRLVLGSDPDVGYQFRRKAILDYPDSKPLVQQEAVFTVK